MSHSVELVWSTNDAEKLISKMARVSNPDNEENHETAPKLLKYLIKHKHWSPFEMASMCVSIITQRDISAQILRHRSFSFQELSTRYATAGFYSLPLLRRQDLKNKQNSTNDLPEELSFELRNKTLKLLDEVYELYSEMLSKDVAKETARRILPLCTNTRMYMAGSLRSWIHYLQLRCHKDTQLEHRLIAMDIRKIFSEQFPVIAEVAFGLDLESDLQ
jgi:thymidylate synthase (FAD)